MPCKVIQWIENGFHTIKVKIAPAVVGILQMVQAAENTGLLPGIAAIIDKMTGTLVASNINAQLKVQVVNEIALWLGVETLSADATPEDEAKFEQAILDAFISKKAQQTVPGQVVSALGVQVYAIIKKLVADAKVHETAITAPQITGAIEEAFQDYQQDLAAAKATQEDDAS